MPWPCGASNDPMTLPFLSMWIIDGGCTQQSAIGGESSASSSMSVRSFGRSNTQTLSSLSTARPVTPPIFHLLGRGLGQSGSNLNLGAVCAGAAATHETNKPTAASKQIFIEVISRPNTRAYLQRMLDWLLHEGGTSVRARYPLRLRRSFLPDPR